jgi:hypothetical protein
LTQHISTIADTDPALIQRCLFANYARFIRGRSLDIFRVMMRLFSLAIPVYSFDFGEGGFETQAPFEHSRSIQDSISLDSLFRGCQLEHYSEEFNMSAFLHDPGGI